MKSKVKKLSYYPATIATGVYVDNSNVTLQDLIKSGELETIAIEKLQAYSTKLLKYKGEFDYNKYSETKSNANVGDFWLYKDSTIVEFDGSIAYKNNIVYLDSDGYLKTIFIPLTNDITPQKKYDVCIIGGGAGGIGAAYALKDSGLRVCLVEKLDTLGGTHCNGVGMLIASPVCDWYKPVVKEAYANGTMEFYNNKTSDHSGAKVGSGDEFDKLWRASQFGDPKNVINNFTGNHIKINDGWFSDKYFDDLNKTIDILINHELKKTNSTNRKVESITVKNTLNGKEFDIFADYFIDCSGDGVLFTSDTNLTLDTDYYVGTDGRARFNETVYPSGYVPDHYGINTVEPAILITGVNYAVASHSLLPNRQHYKKFPNDGMVQKANFGYSFPHPTFKNTLNSVSWSWGTKMNLQDFIEKSVPYNEADGYDRAYALYCINGVPATNISTFGGIRKLLAIREKFRIACESTVTQNSLLTKIDSSNYQSEHTIALSTWYVDIHNQTYSCPSNIPNGVPYEALIPKCYTNSLVACRAYGASHIGLSSIRLVKTMMDLGHSAGIAIKQLCYSDTRGDVRTVDVAAVQNEISILNVINDLEANFFGDTVTTE